MMIEHLFMSVFAVYKTTLMKYLFVTFVHFLIGLFGLFLLWVFQMFYIS